MGTRLLYIGFSPALHLQCVSNPLLVSSPSVSCSFFWCNSSSVLVPYFFCPVPLLSVLRSLLHCSCSMCTDKKENKIFLICKEIQMGAVAKSYMKKGFLIYEEMHNYLVIYEEALFIYDLATVPFWIFLYCT
jgi:hypothetical protein